PRQTRLLRVDWPVDSCRTHAAVSAHPRRTGGSGHFDCFVAFAAGGRRDACPPEPAPWPGRSPRSFSSGSFCFCDLGGGVGLWRPSRPEFRRTRALLRVFVLGAWLVLFNLGSQHCPGTICAPPLACYAGFLEPLAGGRLSGSTGGTRCPCWLFLGAVYDRCGGAVWFIFSWLGYPPPQPSSGPQSLFLGARMIVANVALALIFALFFWLATLFVLFLLRALLRTEWAAAVAWILLFTVFTAARSQFAPDVLV